MNSAIEELHYHLVERPGLDAFPSETAPLKRRLEGLSLDQLDAHAQLVNNASITAFRCGLRLGLTLGQECPLPPRPLP